MTAPFDPKPAILCVDDEDIILETLQEQLQRNFGKDFNIETAKNAEEALELVRMLKNPKCRSTYCHLRPYHAGRERRPPAW